jgi:glycosyltransferase involved in cell wall biosynthesis
MGQKQRSNDLCALCASAPLRGIKIMHVLYIQPGSGGSFYCQNCLRDVSACNALRKSGHEVTMLPLYLPATADAAAPDEIPVFYSAVTLYLRHKYPWLHKLPRSWFKPLDSWPVLKFAARFAGSTSASGLEDLTLSMLRGMQGHQAEDLAMLAEWVESLPQGDKPDLIILSNALLMGLAERLKTAANAPVICWLQDEHVWTDAMHTSLKNAVLRTMREEAGHVDRFISVSSYYRSVMSTQLEIDKSAIEVIYPGIDITEYTLADIDARPQKIGFLSRLSKDEGFDTFVDAYIELRENPEFDNVKLSATGGPSPDKNFLRQQMCKLKEAGLTADVDISFERFAKDRYSFLAELTLLSVPGGSSPEALGYYALEAMASGVPVVLPAHGAFPEFVSPEKGGILFASAEPRIIAQTWAELLSSPERLKALSANARANAESAFNERIVAEKITNLFI